MKLKFYLIVFYLEFVVLNKFKPLKKCFQKSVINIFQISFLFKIYSQWFYFKYLFSPVDSPCQLTPTATLSLLSLLEKRSFFVKKLLTCKDKRGALVAVCTPTLKSVLGQRTPNVQNSFSLKNCVPYQGFGHPLYRLKLGFTFVLPLTRVPYRMSLHHYSQDLSVSGT